MSTQSKKRDVRKLEQCKRDLADDNGEIREINRLVDELQSYFREFIRADNTYSVTDRMEELNEPSEQSDYDIINAVNYITREINALNREIESETAAANTAAKVRSLIDGGMGGR